jgi:hypothetical protein
MVSVRGPVTGAPAAASSGAALGAEEVAALHRKLLAAHARNDDAAAAALTKQLRSGLSFTRKVQVDREASGALSGRQGGVTLSGRQGGVALSGRQGGVTLSGRKGGVALSARRSTSGSAPAAERPERYLFTDLPLFESHLGVKALSELELELALVVVSNKYWEAVHGEREARWRRTMTTVGPGPPLVLGAAARELLLAKERRGLIFWLGDGAGERLTDLSAWLSAMSDHNTGNRYHGLELSVTWWKREFPANDSPARFTQSGHKVASLLQSGAVEPLSLLELLYQANPHMIKLVR